MPGATCAMSCSIIIDSWPNGCCPRPVTRPDPVKAWFQRYQAEVSRVSVMLEEMRNTGAADYPSMQVAIKGLGQLLNATS